MPRLKEINAGSVGLRLVEPCHCPDLVRLQLYQNQITTLDVSQNQKLDQLDLSSNWSIRRLDLSKNMLLDILM